MRQLVLALVVALAGGILPAEDRAPRGHHAPIPLEAPPAPVDATPRIVPLVEARATPRPPRPDARLGLVQAIEIREGEATLVLAGGQRTVRPGDVVAGDTVKVVEPGRLVLSRPDPQGGAEGIVIVRFDEKGRGRVAVYSARDTSPAAPPLPARR